MKKVFFLMLVMALALLMLAGCGDNGGHSDNYQANDFQSSGANQTNESSDSETPNINVDNGNDSDSESQNISNENGNDTIAPSPAVLSGLGNTIGNFANRGYIAYSNGRVYVSRTPYLYSMNVDGSDIRTFSSRTGIPSTAEASHIHVFDNYVYFRNTHGSIVGINIDNGNISIPGARRPMDNTSDGIFATQFRIIDDTIFYVFRDGTISIFSANIDGSNRHRISDEDENIVYFTVIDNRIYFTIRGDDSTLHSMNFDGSDRRVVVSDSESIGNFINYSNGRIFYRDTSGIFSMTPDGSDNQQLIDMRRIITMHVDGDVIYFVVNPTNGRRSSSIYSMNIDGSDVRQLVTDIDTPRIYVAGGRLFLRFSNSSAIYSMNPDGSDLRRILD